MNGPEQIPANLAEWKDMQGNQAIFRMKGGEPESEACKLLEIGPTNRVVTDQEAKLLLILQVQSIALGPEYRWVAGIAQLIEEFQLSIGTPKNSRETFAAVLTQSLRAKNEEKMSWIDRLTGKKPAGE